MSGFPGNRRARLRALAIAALLSGVMVIGWSLVHAGTELVVERHGGAPDAIIMLASHEWERLPAAAALAREYQAAVVLLTEPARVTVHNCHSCGERINWLVEEGVNRERVRLLRGAANTFGEAVAARQYARYAPFTSLTVVTSPYHTRRALATFVRVFTGSGVRIAVVPAAPARGEPRRWWLHPYDRYYVRYEWAAIVKNWWDHGVPIRRAGTGLARGM